MEQKNIQDRIVLSMNSHQACIQVTTKRKEDPDNISEKIFTRRLELHIQLKGGMGGQSIKNLWFFYWRNILYHILGQIPRVWFNLEDETIILWWRYEGNEFIRELIKITPIGRRKWVDRKIKDERSIKRRIRMSSGNATTDLFNMIIIENFIFWKRNIRMSSGTATTDLFYIKAESFKLGHITLMFGNTLGLTWDWDKFSTPDFMNSSDFVAGMVSRCSSPILKELSGSSVDRTGSSVHLNTAASDPPSLGYSILEEVDE
nr:hypothetical protein [Tanacetum cinerariifolium]